MSKQNIRLVGGFLDGQMVVVEWPGTEYRVPYLPPSERMKNCFVADANPVPTQTFETMVYRDSGWRPYPGGPKLFVLMPPHGTGMKLLSGSLRNIGVKVDKCS